MQSSNNLFNDDSVKQAIRLANSKEGRQLLELLKATKGSELNAAMQQASAGNYDAVKSTLSELLNTHDAQELLKRMGEK